MGEWESCDIQKERHGANQHAEKLTPIIKNLISDAGVLHHKKCKSEEY